MGVMGEEDGEIKNLKKVILLVTGNCPVQFHSRGFFRTHLPHCHYLCRGTLVISFWL